MTESFVYGNWYCSNGFNPHKCPILDNGDRIACINITEIAPVVDDHFIGNKADKCQWLLLHSSNQKVRKK
jgi:hypothetical protein